MESPLVSVIIPSYNRAQLLKEAVESVLSQTFTGFELIIVDDGSTDNTRSLLSEWVQCTEARVKPLFIKHCGMPGAVRNRGVEIAKGKYIAFLDSDDLWKPDKLKKQTDFFKSRPEFRITHTRELWLRNRKVVSQSGQRHKRDGDIFTDALVKCIVGPSTVMMERSLFTDTGGFREDLEIAEDYEFWLRITALHGIGYIDEPLTIKRAGHKNQLSEKYGHIEYFRIKALKDLVDTGWFETTGKQQSAQDELLKKCRIYAIGCRKRGKTAEAEEYEDIAGKYSKT